jgi:hypothetical protein
MHPKFEMELADTSLSGQHVATYRICDWHEAVFAAARKVVT